MEKAVEQIEAMFQKAESDINNLSQKLKYEFDNNAEKEENPVRLMDKITDVKTEYSALKEELVSIQDVQKEAVQEFKGHITNVCMLLQKLQSAGVMSGEEKPEELKQLESLLQMSLPTDDNTRSLPTEASCPPGPSLAPVAMDSGIDLDKSPIQCSDSSLEEPEPSLASKRKSSGEFLEVTQAEFESVSSLVRGRVKLSEVNQTYEKLWEDWKANKDSRPYKPEDMSKMGLRVTGATGQAKLKVLRALNILKITSKGDVTLLV